MEKNDIENIRNQQEDNQNGKYTKEDIEFFNNLAEEYGLEQTEEYLVINKKDGTKVFLPKWYEVPTKNGDRKSIEDLIKENL